MERGVVVRMRGVGLRGMRGGLGRGLWGPGFSPPPVPGLLHKAGTWPGGVPAGGEGGRGCWGAAPGGLRGCWGYLGGAEGTWSGC